MSSSRQDDQGYAVFAGVFERAEMEAMLKRLCESGLARTRAGARHLLRVPAVRDMSVDPRLVGIAAQFVGPHNVAFRATLFDKSAGANWLVAWHQDTALPLQSRIESPEWGPWSVKSGVLYAHAPAWALERVVALRVSLDDSSAANGPLRVLPGTHRNGLYTDEQVERLAREVPPIDCLAPAGGVVAMRPLTIHASSKSTGDQPRRVLHIEYATAAILAPGVELATV